jgi:hypothetical protein
MGTGTGLVLKISMFPAVWPEPVPISSQVLIQQLRPLRRLKIMVGEPDAHFTLGKLGRQQSNVIFGGPTSTIGSISSQ